MLQKCDPRAFARCPYSATCISVDQAEFAENSDCALFNKKVLDSPSTNADKIRGMTDIQMATFLHSITRACADRDCANCPIGEENCIVMLHWLRKTERKS